MQKDVKTGILVGVALSISVTLIISLLSQSLQDDSMTGYDQSDDRGVEGYIPPSVIVKDNDEEDFHELTEQEKLAYEMLSEAVEKLDQSEEIAETAPPVQQEAPKPVEPEVTVHIVGSGDTLSSIAVDYYGKSRDWRKIYEANKSVIPNPNALKIGTRLVIPD